MAAPAMKEMKVFAYHKETVKPSSPTPSHLQTLNLSFIDQTLSPRHSPTLLFYGATSGGGPTSVGHRLKKSLSETLTRFYPFAGRLSMDAPVINCNDEGALYVEARANFPMAIVLQRPQVEELSRFIPTSPADVGLELVPLVLIQSTFFGCGGMAIAIAISHKVSDAFSNLKFIEAWSRVASGILDAPVVPDFTAPSRFPSVPVNPYTPPDVNNVDGCTQRRFVFDDSKVRKLKAIAASDAVPHPSRTEVVSALLWKCFTKAAAAARICSDHGRSENKFSSSTLVWAVNFRPFLIPPLPHCAIGNIFGTLCFMEDEKTTGGNRSVQAIVCQLRKERKELIQNFSEVNTIVSLSHDYAKHWEEAIENGDCYAHYISSLCEMDFYGTNFGWGKPIWFGAPFTDERNITLLTDSPDGRGVEAWVSMGEEELILLENDPELSAFAIVSPSLLNNAKEASHPTPRPSAL